MLSVQTSFNNERYISTSLDMTKNLDAIAHHAGLFGQPHILPRRL